MPLFRRPVRAFLAAACAALLLLAPAREGHAAAAAEAPEPDPEPRRVEDLAWIAGRWEGEIGGQPVEEQWSVPAGGAMMGMFRWLRDGKPFLYEHFLLEPGPEGPVMFLRHFHPGSVAWEERDAAVPFTLVSLAEGDDGPEAVFEDRTAEPPVRLTYRREGEGALVVLLDTWRGERPLRLEFRYRRVGD